MRYVRRGERGCTVPAYWAVIADIVRSRRITDRAAFQSRLEQLLGEINDQHGPSLAAGWTITLGDEFQALLYTPQRLPGIVEHLVHGLNGQAVRFGIGYGSLTTVLRPQAIGMDGPCFHRARDAVEAARRSKRLVVVEPPGASAQRATDLWNLALTVTGARTDRQAEIVEAYKTDGNQTRVAERLGITQGVVSRELARSRFAEVSAVLPHIAALLAEVSADGAL